ncbi:tudor domain-containing protein 7 [Pogonomyrmex barbatus]|uniref:Tudor domain-containing protein 7 n=1 Tax=Pogonomyrmex barbatus TaxID=144034 RepID=A0A6I9VSQ1_9HYME|nr:tudor domain-containing protein 7 [Pogonomyrmex barbatus]XP_011630820.1 tudor domain-containing protein 7 [Pogonomyrmex barbatus]XP_011630821.1 tudor domain-containing protein 7 [Pogonomyrmex barbatus]XP_011630822.1 tudor domain-containing protein 7 [Pogonomyrmex barbatus]
MDIDEVIKNLRSCLISCKGGIKLDDLKKDYHMVAGEILPFKKFGYSSVDAFVRDIPDVSVIKKNGELYVEAVPSKTSAHLTKLVSRQKARRKIRPQKKWTPSRHNRGGSFPSNGFQSARSNHVNSSSFTKSTPGKSNLYTDFSRPIPLMETTVQCPLPINDKASFTPTTPPSTPIKRLKDKGMNPNTATVNQSVNNYKTIEDLRRKVLNDNTALPVINQKPKIVELRPPKPSERLKIISSTTPSPPIDNNGCTSTPISSNFNIPKMTPPFKIPDARKELEIHTNMLNLPPPIYKMYSKKEKNSTKTTIYASVKVGMHTLYTFPEDATSEEEAEKIAARLALVTLAKESSSPEVTTADEKLIKERILDIITQHHSGVFMHLLPECYNEQYGEALPHNWQTIIEECGDINQEKGVGDSTILCRSSLTLKRSESSPSSKNVSENIFLFNEKSCLQLNPIGPAVPDVQPVPEANIWQVITTYVESTVEIWIRLSDQNNEYVDMTNEMTRHYNQINKSTSVTCVIGDFYAVLDEYHWRRVKCIDFDTETGIATVFFIDEGYDGEYKSDVLHPLDKKFCNLKSQALRVGLQGLKDFRDCSQIVTEIENYLLPDQLFNVKVHGVETDEYGEYSIVTFYDTSHDDKDIDVNQVIFNKILDDMAVAFKLHAGKLIELYVTHIDKHGKIYAQLNSFIRTVLNSENISPLSTNDTVKAINFTKTYLVKYGSQWYRAKVIDIPDDRKVLVFLIDIGQIILIPREYLFHMDSVSKALQYIPPQAINIFLHNIDQSMYNERLVTRFRELVSDTDLLLAKVIRITSSGIPVMEIFKRVGPNNMLASINTSLIYDGELSKIDEDNNNNNKFKKRLERKNSRAPESVGKLNPPIIPPIGSYFDVHVTLVAHPGHFIVQPLENVNKLRAMMIELQKYCEAYDGPSLESVSEGKLYAGNLRGDWYRVYVTNIISENEISVYFCDYGDVTIIKRSSMQPLQSKFLELAYQAVKAKLVGIEPINVDWSVTDCVKFKELVLDKNFVSVVVETMFDDLSPVNGTMLGLQLIDVSQADIDIYIDRLLVEEKRAKYIDSKIDESKSLPS